MYPLGYGTRVIENRLKFSLWKANEIPGISKQYARFAFTKPRAGKASQDRKLESIINWSGIAVRSTVSVKILGHFIV